MEGFEDLDLEQNVVDLGKGATRVDIVIELDEGRITLQGVGFDLQASDLDFIG